MVTLHTTRVTILKHCTTTIIRHRPHFRKCKATISWSIASVVVGRSRKILRADRKGRASLSRLHDRAHMVARQCAVEAYCAAVSDGIAGTYSSRGVMFPVLCAVYTREITIRRSIASCSMLNPLGRNFSMEIASAMPASRLAARGKERGKGTPLNFHLAQTLHFA